MSTARAAQEQRAKEWRQANEMTGEADEYWDIRGNAEAFDRALAAALAACAREADHAALERVVYMLESMQIDSVPNLVDRGRVIDCVRALERAAGESGGA